MLCALSKPSSKGSDLERQLQRGDPVGKIDGRCQDARLDIGGLGIEVVRRGQPPPGGIGKRLRFADCRGHGISDPTHEPGRPGGVRFIELFYRAGAAMYPMTKA
jgi:hypothetical protein